MTLFRLAVLVTLSSALSLAQDAPPAGPPASASPASVSADPRVRGEKAFADNGCGQCHTIARKGGTKGPDLSGVGRRLDQERLRTQIMNGGKQMPPFADVLQASETDDLVAYLQSLREKNRKTGR